MPQESLEHSEVQRAGEEVLESGHGAGFIKAASGGASWHSTEHKHSLVLSHQHPGQQGGQTGTEMDRGGTKISTHP